MDDIREKLKTFVSIGANILKDINELEALVKRKSKEKDAVENETKSFKAEKLKVAQDVQSRESSFKKYEQETRAILETEKARLQVLIKDYESKLVQAEDKLKDAKIEFSHASKARQEAESLKQEFSGKVKKFNDFV